MRRERDVGPERGPTHTPNERWTLIHPSPLPPYLTPPFNESLESEPHTVQGSFVVKKDMWYNDKEVSRTGVQEGGGIFLSFFSKYLIPQMRRLSRCPDIVRTSPSVFYDYRFAETSVTQGRGTGPDPLSVSDPFDRKVTVGRRSWRKDSCYLFDNRDSHRDEKEDPLLRTHPPPDTHHQSSVPRTDRVNTRVVVEPWTTRFFFNGKFSVYDVKVIEKSFILCCILILSYWLSRANRDPERTETATSRM